ncbi:protein DWD HYPERSENSITIVE TO UV-B 1 isoform X2 [Aristolochia californica]
MTGKFMQLHTLNLDFSISLTNFQEGCFNCMPRLTRLSLCETRVSNLWTTCSALLRLPSLQELRFQNCLCCNDTGPCPTSSDGKRTDFINEKSDVTKSPLYPYWHTPSTANKSLIFEDFQYTGSEDMFIDQWSDDESLGCHGVLLGTTEESSDESEQDLATQQRASEEMLYDPMLDLRGWTEPENFVNTVENDACEMDGLDYLHGFLVPDKICSHSQPGTSKQEGPDITNAPVSEHIVGPSGPVMRKYVSHHPSPICFEKHYREYMIASLPHLKVLDNLSVKKAERDMAKTIFSQYYEYLPYNRQHNQSIVSILHKRELGFISASWKSLRLRSYSSERGQNSFRRAICAAKVGSSAWPYLYPLSRSISDGQAKSFRPRQFEYHPCDPSLMVFGTLDGELVVVNHENGNIVGYIQSGGALQSILGLCWLKKSPTKLIAGSDNGSLRLYDISQIPTTVTDRYCTADSSVCTYDEFEHLTSVHVNSTDDLFLASGYSRHVALYDIGSGRRVQVLKDLHSEHINVVKFAHHSPSIFATSSFDQQIKMWDLRQGTSQPCYTAFSSRGNIMVCFSPDDYYLLSSAVDNEVKQLLAADGSISMRFDIAPTGSAQNYTRSYYMNGRDYIISGSCEENIVRICCAQTGRRLRDVSLEGTRSRHSMFVQSLRGDPFRDFHMSILAAYLHPSSESDIIKVNLLASSRNYSSDTADRQHWRSFNSMGG